MKRDLPAASRGSGTSLSPISALFPSTRDRPFRHAPLALSRSDTADGNEGASLYPAHCLLWEWGGLKATHAGAPFLCAPLPPPPPSPPPTPPPPLPLLFFLLLFHAVGVQADASRLKYAAPLTLFPGTTFRGDSSCSPHSPTSYLTLADTPAVPGLELPGPALRFWRAVPTGEGEVRDLTWMDLTVRVRRGRDDGGGGGAAGGREGGGNLPGPPGRTPPPSKTLTPHPTRRARAHTHSLSLSLSPHHSQSGALILANPSFNATTSTRGFTYTILGDNAVDRRARGEALATLRAAVGRLAAGQAAGPVDPATGRATAFTCNKPQPALDGLVKYLDGAIGAGRAAATSGELRPREEAVAGGLCVAESAAVYAGTPLAGPAGTPTTAASLEECCAKCAAAHGCAVFTWCPISPGGCEGGRDGTTAGAALPLPYLACVLKGAPAGPGAGGPAPGPPPKGVRGPPLLAMSGRVNAPASA